MHRAGGLAGCLGTAASTLMGAIFRFVSPTETSDREEAGSAAALSRPRLWRQQLSSSASGSECLLSFLICFVTPEFGSLSPPLQRITTG